MNRQLPIPLLLAALALAGCGDDPAPTGPGAGYTLPRRSPLPETLRLEDGPVRTLLVRHEERANPDGRGIVCGLTTLLFDVTAASGNSPAAIDDTNGCRLYTEAPEVYYPRQRQVCAGAFSLRSGGLDDTLSFCPPMGARPPIEQALSSCGAIGRDRSATVLSADEGVEGDAVTDLTGTLRFPTAVIITEPTRLAIATWPEAGDLTVAWESAEATSALVRIERVAVADPSASPVILCNPTRQGRVVVRQDLLAQAGFRTQDARVRVWSFRDNDVQAEGGRTYRLSGAMVSNLYLQARR
jgi:hypothetical protein